jgi:glycosyltransferase involved in cell wall biosynthesis
MKKLQVHIYRPVYKSLGGVETFTKILNESLADTYDVHHITHTDIGHLSQSLSMHSYDSIAFLKSGKPKKEPLQDHLDHVHSSSRFMVKVKQFLKKIPYLRGILRRINRFKDSFYDQSRQRFFIEYLTQKPCALFIFQDIDPWHRIQPILGALEQLKIPSMRIDHGDLSHNWPAEKIRKMIEKSKSFPEAKIKQFLYNVYHGSDAYVFHSWAMKKKYESYMPMSQLYAIHNITNLVPCTESLENLLQQKEKIILFIGRWATKRLEKFLEQAHQLQWQTHDYTLVVIGRGGQDDPILPAFAKAKQNGIHLEYFPSVSEEHKIELLKKSSLFILPSDHEGFGIVLVEAMMYASVPLCFHCYEGIDEVVLPEQTGVVVQDIHNWEEYFAKLSYLMQDATQRSNFAIQAFKHSKNFNPERFKQEWIAAIEQTIQKRKTYA